MKSTLLYILTFALCFAACKKDGDESSPAIRTNTLVHGNNTMEVDTPDFFYGWWPANDRMALQVNTHSSAYEFIAISLNFPKRPTTTISYRVALQTTIKLTDSLAVVSVIDSNYDNWYSLGTDSATLAVTILDYGKLSFYCSGVLLQKGGSTNPADTIRIAFNLKEY